MLFNIGTVGFSKLDDTDKRYKVINDVINNSTNTQFIETLDSKKFVENKKQYGKDIGVIVRGVQKDNKITVTNIVPYADSVKKIPIKEISIEKVNLDFFKGSQILENEYHVTFVNSQTDMKITFYLQNVVEYLKSQEDEKNFFEGVHISALAYGGKIVLPLANEECDECFGSYDASDDEEDDLDEEEMCRIITEGNLLEDMEQYFIQSQKIDTVYYALGIIKSVKRLNNIETKETIYKLEVDTMRMTIDIYVNKKDLVGMPSVGMRFMGTCWLQGNIMFG